MHDKLTEIANERQATQHAFQAIGELGRYPRTLPVDKERVMEAVNKARHDAKLLLRIADQLENMTR